MFNTIGFIGCGNMGSAVARAVRRIDPVARMYFANRSPEKAAALAQELGGQTGDNLQIARECELIVLGVKPQMLDQVLNEMAHELARREERFVLVTMAAGRTIDSVVRCVGWDCPVVRIMPNTPAAIGAGVVQLCARDLSGREKEDIMLLLSGAGLVDEVPESLIDAASALSGCGPAFVYLFLEALADGGVACGLPRDKAMMYAARTLEGAARLAAKSGTHPGALKDAVCSPGGSTIQGVRTLEERGFRAAAMDAVIAAFEKTQNLGK